MEATPKKIAFLIAPTEPSDLRATGQTTLVTEKHGCDVIGISSTAIVGYQRKTPDDLLASLHDGRLAKQIAQIKSSALLTHAILIIEGEWQWTTDGQLLSSYNVGFTRKSLMSLIVQIQVNGIVLLQTDGLTDTISTLNSVTISLSKSSHQTLFRRPKQSLTSWGTKNSAEWANHLLQSFDGIGPATATSLVTFFGKLPLAWTCSEAQLKEVPGIGKTLARSLYRALE
jgi:ERCC4-type nuclease